MSDEHQHPAGDPSDKPGGRPEAGLDDDAGSRALSDALRSSFFIVQIVMVILVVIFLGSGFFTVGPQERAVILRLGKPVGAGNEALLGPGFHWAFPPPVDEVVKIPFSQSQTVNSTVGWYYTSPEEAAAEAAAGTPPKGTSSLDPTRDGYTIVGDGNIIHARASLSYRVEDPIRYKFDFVDASNSVQNALDNALIYASARFTNVDDVLRRQRTLFQETVRGRVDDLVQKDGLGIAIEQCQVEEIPPVILAPDFENVTTELAKVDEARNKAESDRFTTTNAAASEAARIVIAAETDRQQMITNLMADSNLFTEFLPMYRTNATLVKDIFRLRTIAQVVTNVGGLWYIPASPGGKWEVRVQTGPTLGGQTPTVGPVDTSNKLD